MLSATAETTWSTACMEDHVTPGTTLCVGIHVPRKAGHTRPGGVKDRKALGAQVEPHWVGTSTQPALAAETPPTHLSSVDQGCFKRMDEHIARLVLRHHALGRVLLKVLNVKPAGNR
jgi:hypothetical protein